MTRLGGGRSWADGPMRRSSMSRGSAPIGRFILLAIIAIAVVLIAIAGYSAVFGGGESCNETYCESSSGIPIPAGFTSFSEVYERNLSADPLPEGFDLQITIPLTAATADNRNLSFHGYDATTGLWQPLASAVLDETGAQATGLFADPPRYLAVLRRLSEGGHVVAYLEPGATLHPRAAAHVTIVHTFDFTPLADGTLAGELSTPPATEAAHYPVLSASAELPDTVPNLDAILATGAERSNHVRRILQRLAAVRVAGIDIAYLELRADQRTSFTLFVAELAEGLHAEGKVLTLTLPAPVKAPDRIDEGAYDWASLGRAADVLKIAPVRDQGTYRLEMPDVLEHLISLVEPSKLVLTVTPYASEKSADGLRRLSLTEAMTIASKLAIRSESVVAGSEIEVVGINIDREEGLSGLRWRPETATVAFTYKLNGGRTVWIENVFSIGFKLEFVSDFGLGGFAVEDASENIFLGDIWGAIEPFVETGQPVLLQPNPGDLLPRWEATGGSLQGGDGGLVTWQTPEEPGTYTVTLSLSEGVYRFESEVTLALQPPAAVQDETAARVP